MSLLFARKMLKTIVCRKQIILAAFPCQFPGHIASSGLRFCTSKYEQAAREDKLDFITASKILFSPPSKPKKFGFDFHLVQFFFACMPSLAVYLVAQYARYEMRKMEAELEKREKLAEEEKLTESSETETTDKSKDSTDTSERDKDISTKESTKILRGLSSNEKDKGIPIKESEKILRELSSRLDALEETVQKLAVTDSGKGPSDMKTDHKVKPVKQSNGNSAKKLTMIDSGRGSTDIKAEHKVEAVKQSNENSHSTEQTRNSDSQSQTTCTEGSHIGSNKESKEDKASFHERNQATKAEMKG